MKKRLLMLAVLAICMCLLTGCVGSEIFGLRSPWLESIFGEDTEEENETRPADNQSDTVTISREEYEQYQQFNELIDLIDFAENAFYKDTDREKMLQYAAKGLMAGLDDPYSFYYTPDEWSTMWEDDEGEYDGIGVLINANYKTGICTIIRVFKGSPAEEAGVQRGDILYKVGDDLFVTAETLQDAVDIMKGQAGSSVDVTFIRNEEEITYNIMRRKVNVNQVESTMLDKDIGYIALYQFAGAAEKEFETAMRKLITGGAKGLIIDLRDNPGGWVEQARYIADLFMDKGELCYLVYKDGYEDHTEYLTRDGKVNVKLVVLMNENSASSSEILAGALRDSADATLVGTVSFGKGIVQAVTEVGKKGAGFQMTVASYRTPKGTEVHEVGIIPDVEVKLPEGDNGMYDFADLEHDVQLQKALEAMKEKLK